MTTAARVAASHNDAHLLGQYPSTTKDQWAIRGQLRPSGPGWKGRWRRNPCGRSGGAPWVIAAGAIVGHGELGLDVGALDKEPDSQAAFSSLPLHITHPPTCTNRIPHFRPGCPDLLPS